MSCNGQYRGAGRDGIQTRTSIEIGPLDVVALMDALERAHHISTLDCDEHEVFCAEWEAALNG